MAYTTEARQFMEAKADDDLRGIIEFADDPYRTANPDTRTALDGAADMARDILAKRHQ